MTHVTCTNQHNQIKSNQIKFIFSDISNIFTILQIYIFNHINIHNINDDMFKGFEILK